MKSEFEARTVYVQSGVDILFIPYCQRLDLIILFRFFQFFSLSQKRIHFITIWILFSFYTRYFI